MNELKPAVKFVGPTNTIEIADALKAFASSEETSGQLVHLLRPFAVYSKNTYSAPIIPPIGVAYLAAVLEKAGYRVGVIDAAGKGVNTFTTTDCGRMLQHGLTTEDIISLIDPTAAIIAITLMFSQEWVALRKLINAIREALPEISIIVGGEHATSLPEFILRDCPAIDFLATGEGELTLLEFTHRKLNNKPMDGINGVCWIDDCGEFRSGGLSARISDFQNLPYPAWHLFPIKNYFKGYWSLGISSGSNARNMPILATRGCPYQCTFCSNPTMWTTRYLMRDVDNVVDEIEWLLKTYGVDSVDFADLTAIVKKNWVIAFCQELMNRKLDIVWQLPVGTRSEALDAETLKAIHDSGCRFMTYAPESGTPETLRVIKKMVKLDNLLASVRDAINIGHTIKCNFIIGFPHEKRQSIWRTMFTAIKLAFKGIDDCNISIFSPYPGSELFRDLQEKGVIPELNDEYFNNLVIRFDFTSIAAVCENVGGRELRFYRVATMSLFYGFSYLVYPGRIINLLKNIILRNFHARNMFEQRVFDALVRKWINA